MPVLTINPENNDLKDGSTEEQNSGLDQETLDKGLGWLEEVISGVSEETWSYLQEGIKYNKNKSED